MKKLLVGLLLSSTVLIAQDVQRPSLTIDKLKQYYGEAVALVRVQDEYIVQLEAEVTGLKTQLDALKKSKPEPKN